MKSLKRFKLTTDFNAWKETVKPSAHTETVTTTISASEISSAIEDDSWWAYDFNDEYGVPVTAAAYGVSFLNRLPSEHLSFHQDEIEVEGDGWEEFIENYSGYTNVYQNNGDPSKIWEKFIKLPVQHTETDESGIQTIKYFDIIYKITHTDDDGVETVSEISTVGSDDDSYQFGDYYLVPIFQEWENEEDIISIDIAVFFDQFTYNPETEEYSNSILSSAECDIYSGCLQMIYKFDSESYVEWDCRGLGYLVYWYDENDPMYLAQEDGLLHWYTTGWEGTPNVSCFLCETFNQDKNKPVNPITTDFVDTSTEMEYASPKRWVTRTKDDNKVHYMGEGFRTTVGEAVLAYNESYLTIAYGLPEGSIKNISVIPTSFKRSVTPPEEGYTSLLSDGISTYDLGESSAPQFDNVCWEFTKSNLPVEFISYTDGVVNITVPNLEEGRYYIVRFEIEENNWGSIDDGLYADALFYFDFTPFKTVTTIDSYTFQQSCLKSIDIPDTVTSIGDGAFKYSEYLKTVNLGNNVRTIPFQCFYGCYSLENIDLKNVNSIGNEAFYNCNTLKSITIPNYCNSIGDYAFSDCYRLASITIPDSVTTIGGGAFYNCYGLTGVTIDATTPPSISSNIFSSCPNLSTIIVPYSSVDAYKTATNWSSYAGKIISSYTPQTYKLLTITADDVKGNATATTIYYTFITDGIDRAGTVVTDVPVTGKTVSDPFEQNTSETETVQRTITYSDHGLTAQTTITQGVWVDQNYSVNLNGEWIAGTKNPDDTTYEQYMSNAHKGIDSSYDSVKITFVGYENFTVYINSYAESVYDYTVAFGLDVDKPTSLPDSGTTGAVANTSGKQLSPSTVSNYTKVEYPNDGGEHSIWICYRKDGSSASDDDRGYILIPKNQ